MEPNEVEDNPKFPVKAVSGAATAVVAWLATQPLDSPWQQIVTLLAIGLGVYLPKNPKRMKR